MFNFANLCDFIERYEGPNFLKKFKTDIYLHELTYVRAYGL